MFGPFLITMIIRIITNTLKMNTMNVKYFHYIFYKFKYILLILVELRGIDDHVKKIIMPLIFVSTKNIDIYKFLNLRGIAEEKFPSYEQLTSLKSNTKRTLKREIIN